MGLLVKETANPMSRTQCVEVGMHTADSLLRFRRHTCRGQGERFPKGRRASYSRVKE